MSLPKASTEQFSLASEVAKAREHIKKSLECMDKIMQCESDANLNNKVNDTITEVKRLNNIVSLLTSELSDLKREVQQLKGISPQCPLVCSLPPNKQGNNKSIVAEKFWAERRDFSNAEAEYYAKLAKDAKPAPAKSTPAPAKSTPAPAKPAPAPADDDDDVDLFGDDSEEEDADAARIREERLAAYAKKKSTKPTLIAKSNIILDVKPWSDETDMPEIERSVRSITMDGLLWGASKFVPLAFGIKKLQISCVVEDDKVSIDLLQEEIEKFEEIVQSVDIAAFNKI